MAATTINASIATVASVRAPKSARMNACAARPVCKAAKAARSLSSSNGFAGRAQPLVARAPKTQRAAGRQMVVETKAYKVAVLGAAGGIGQPLSLLLKMNPLVTDLRLFDIANTPGVAADLSHLNTTAKVAGYVKEDIEKALTGCDLVIIPAGVPRKPGMTRDDLFAINAGIVYDLITSVAKYCPKAMINIISNPVNSTVPIAAEVLKANGVYDPKKLMGVSTLDIVRADCFVAQMKGLDMKDVDVPVVGGHAGVTILPLLSQVTPKVSFTDEEIEALTVRIQNAGTEVVEAKAGTGSATLSMAYAAARMCESCLRALGGEEGIYECQYVPSTVTELPFFASKCRLGPGGVEEVKPIGDITPYEAKWLEQAKAELKGSIEKGVAFAQERAAAAK